MVNKYAIIMATYNRKNGKTPKYLEKSLDSICAQTCDDWDLIIVGDKYEPIEELKDIVDKYIIKLKNLSKNNNNIILLQNDKVERDYIKDKMKLWCCAGANSMNCGLKYCHENNYKYYLHLDDDDYWSPIHIEEINKVYLTYENCIFVNTKSTYKNSYLPNNKIKNVSENNLLPEQRGMIHSSFSFRLDVINFYYKTSTQENEITDASDGLMLRDIKSFLLDNKQYSSIYIPILTCFHDLEGESMRE